MIEHDIFLDDEEVAMKEDLWYNLCRLNDLDTTMKEFILSVKDIEGVVLDLKTFANGIAGVLHNMIALGNIKAIGRVTCVDDNDSWDMKYKDLSQLRENYNSMIELGMVDEYNQLIKSIDKEYSLDKQ